MKLPNYKLTDLIQPMGALLFVPILFTLLFGWIYSEIYVKNVPFAVYDCDNSETSREIVSKFQSNPDLELIGYANSSQELQQMLLEGQIVVGVYLPDNLGQEIREQKSPKILIYVDNTNTVIGNNAYSYAAKVANTVSAGIELNYLEGAGITSAQAEETIGVLSLAERTLYNPQLGYYRYLFAALLAILVQQTYINVATSKLITLRNQLLPKGQIWLKAAKYILYYMSLSTISSLSCILLANYCFNYPIRSSLTPVVGILLIFLLSTLVLAMSANNRTHKSYASTQTDYAARTAIESFFAAMENSDEIALQVEKLGNSPIYANVNIDTASFGHIYCLEDDGTRHDGQIKIERAPGNTQWVFSEKKGSTNASWEEYVPVKITACAELGKEHSQITAYIRKKAPNEPKETAIKGLQTIGLSDFDIQGTFTGGVGIGITENTLGDFAGGSETKFDTELT
ncbi:MAG: ABC transporter permease, partial [Clostridia bacterium]|nr:ABC transporter permease [Clostridia bacterium]